MAALHDPSRPVSACSPRRSRSSSSRATRVPGCRTSPGPPASPPAPSTPTSGARPSCCSTRSARVPTPRSTRCSRKHVGRDVRELLELLGDQLVRPARARPLLIDAIAAARRDDELAGALRDRLGARERVIGDSSSAPKADGVDRSGARHRRVRPVLSHARDGRARVAHPARRRRPMATRGTN